MFGIRAIDRGKHVYVIGKTGMGKSTMLENMAIQDIQNGEGLSFIDPHGSTAEKLLDFIPEERMKDVVYFAPFDTEYPIGFNVMEDVGFDKRHLVVSGLMGAFKRIWVDAWSARMEYILQNTLLALLEYPDSTIIDVNRMLTNKTFRAAVIEKVTDPIVRSFWNEEFATYTDRYTQEATPAIQNKIGAFVSNPLIRNIIGQARSSFDMRKVMDDKKIFIVNLSKGRMGETNASLLGSMLTVKIYLAAMSRADEPAMRLSHLPRHYFYVDEFQSMMNQAFADILSESRKYKLALTLANQYIEQMEEEVRDAVFGNVGTLIVFRVGPFDAEVLETVFAPTFEPEDLVNLGLGQIYLTLMIDGVGSPPFSAETIPPIETPAITYRDDVVTHSRAAYGRARADVEAQINRKQSEFVMPPKEKKPLRAADYRSSSPVRRDESPARSFGGGAPRATPEAREVRERAPLEQRTAPQPRADVHAPSQPRPDVQGAVPRETLREAIDRARATTDKAAAEVRPQGGGPIRSPADILRQKQHAKAPVPHNAGAKPAPVRPSQHATHAPNRPPSRDGEQNPRREQRAQSARPDPAPEARIEETKSGEVTPQALQRILNGGRDNDEL